MHNPLISDFISNARASTRKLIEAKEELDALDEENAQLGHYNALVDGDFEGDNAHIAADDMKAALVEMAGFLAWIRGGTPDSRLKKFLKVK